MALIAGAANSGAGFMTARALAEILRVQMETRRCALNIMVI